MTLLLEADIDYEQVDKAKDGELIYSKPHWFKKAKWVVKYNGETFIFEDYDSGLLAELLIKIKKRKDK